jgi:hypothetical protein
MFPVCWGDTMRENEYSEWVYAGVCGLSQDVEPKNEEK